MRYFAFLAILLMAVGFSTACLAQTNSIDLFTGLKTGVLQAEFRGAGDSSVTGTIRSTNPQLTQLYIPGGSQFQGQQPGRQGMNSYQPQRFGLNSTGETKITVRTACTDIFLPAPTASDVMLPMPCPDERLARLASVVDARSAPQEAAQIAVWAIANNPPAAGLRDYLQRVAPGVPVVADTKKRALMDTAASLLRDAGLDPAAFAMFQPTPQAPPKPSVRQRMEGRRVPGRAR